METTLYRMRLPDVTRTKVYVFLPESRVFRIFDNRPLVLGYSISGLKIRRNRVEKTTDYPSQSLKFPLYDVTDSSDVHIDGP